MTFESPLLTELVPARVMSPRLHRRLFSHPVRPLPHSRSPPSEIAHLHSLGLIQPAQVLGTTSSAPMVESPLPSLRRLYLP